VPAAPFKKWGKPNKKWPPGGNGGSEEVIFWRNVSAATSRIFAIRMMIFYALAAFVPDSSERINDAQIEHLLTMRCHA
jgi:hypothetical protein